MSLTTESSSFFNKFDNVQKSIVIFFLVFPFLLISGPFLPDLSVSIISFCCLFFLHTRYTKIFTTTLFFKLIILFYIYININSLFSDYPQVSFKNSLSYLRIILFSFFLGWALLTIKTLHKTILISFVAAYLILFLDSIYQVSTGYNIIGLALSPTDRVSSFFGEELIMGSFVAKTLPIIIAISFVEDFKNRKILQIVILFISASLVYFSNERTAVLNYLVVFLVYFILTFEKKNFFTILFIIISTIFFLYAFKPKSIDRLYYSTLFQLKEAKNPLLLSYRHELHYQTAYNIFIKNKFIGTGIKSFRYNCSQDLYSVSKKIEKDNTVYSNVSGHIYFKIIFDEKNNPLIKEVNIVENLDDLNSSVYYKKIPGEFFKSYKKNGDTVKKGDKLFSYYEFSNGCNTHPHNLYLQFMSELGIVGLCFLAVLFFYLVYKLSYYLKKIFLNNLKNKKNDYYPVFILISLLLFLFPLIPSGNFFNNWYSIMFSFQFGFLIHFLNLEKN